MKSIIINRLETEPVHKLLLEYSIPAIIGSLVVAVYNLIDSLYIGNGPELGEHAIGGLGLVLPIMTLLTAFALLVGTGAASRVSIYLGMGDVDIAEKVLSNAILLVTSLTSIFILIMYICIEPLLFLIGATGDTYFFAHEFLLYYLPCNIFLNLTFTLCSIMRASGYPKKAMYIMLLGVVSNILLAPIFIFILVLGMKGAAIATLLSTIISLVPAIFHFLDKNANLQLRYNNIFFDPKIIWRILSIGLSPFIIQLAASVVVFFINNRLRVYGGSSAIEAYTIANRLTLMIILIILGLTQGMQPIIGYNYGAKNIERVKSTVHHAMMVGIGIGLVGLLVGFFFANDIIKPFNPSPYLAQESINTLHVIVLMLPLSGLQMVISGFFQSIGMPIQATILSLTRQFLILIPALFILPFFFKLYGIWMSIPVSDFLSTLLAGGMYIWQIRKLNKNINYTNCHY